MKEKTITEYIEKYTSKVPFTDEEDQAGYFVTLDIDHQHFRITETETAKRADWYRRQLAMALVRLVKTESDNK